MVIEWIESGPDGEETHRCTEEHAIETMHQIAEKLGTPYVDDNEALLDFLTVMWAQVVGE